MKIILNTLLILITATFSLSSQSVDESSQSMSLGSQVGYTVSIDGADKNTTENVVKKYFKDHGKVKNNKKAKELYSENIILPMVAGSNEVNLYLKFDERASLTSVTAWVDLGGQFVNGDEHPGEAKGMEQMMSEIYIAVKRQVIENEMKEEEKNMKKLTKELSKLEKNNKNYHKKIADAKKKIEENEGNIEQNLKDQEDQRIKIKNQQKLLDEIISRLNNVGKE